MANSFGDILRGLGSVLNPQVAQEDIQQEAEKRNIQKQFAMLALQRKMQEQSPEYQAKVEALKNEKAFRDAASQAGGDQVKLAQAASQFGKPELAVQLYNAAEQRTATAQQKADALKQQELSLQQTHEYRMAQLANVADQNKRQAAKDLLDAQYKQDMLKLTSAKNSSDAEIKNLGLELQLMKFDQATGKGGGGLTPENAGKVAMAQQSIDAIGTFRKLAFDKDGGLNRGLIAAVSTPGMAGMPGYSDARIARSAIRNAIEAKLRLETGAAATSSEVDRTLDRFLPTIGDTAESAKFKLDELEKFFKSSLSQTKGVQQLPKTPASPSNLDELLKKYAK